MKKKLVTMLLAGATVASIAFTGCSSKSAETTTQATTEATSQTTSTDESVTDPTATQDGSDSASAGSYLDPKGEVTLGKYLGVEVAKEKVEVTDEEVATDIQNEIENSTYYEEVTDHDTVQNDDVVNIDYVGSIDGEEFEGGADSGYDLDIANSTFIDGFAEGVIGMKVGEKKDVVVTFPDPYVNNEDLSGKEAVFAVTLNKIEKEVTPEFNDEYVQENSEYSTVEEYKAARKEEMLAEKEETAATNWEQAVLQNVIDGSTFTNLSDADIESYVAEMTSYYESMAESYGIDFATFLMYFMGTDEATFKEQAKTQGDFVVKQNLVLKKIIETENLTVSDEEYATGLAEYAAQYGYEDTAEFENTVGKESVQEALVYDKAYNLIISSAVATEAAASTVSE